jgi:hypothetical protein
MGALGVGLVFGTLTAGLPMQSYPCELAYAECHHEFSLSVPILHATALMTGMRIGAALIWPRPFADVSGERLASSYEAAYTRPPKFELDQPAFRWDGDPLVVNVAGHALFGSELYLRARTCRLGVWGALGFAAAGSTVWEYGFEASAVRPSALDLVYTPIAGFLLGEGRYQLWDAAFSIRDRTLRDVVQVALDPFGELERAAGTVC